jgi:hypothetical protein
MAPTAAGALTGYRYSVATKSVCGEDVEFELRQESAAKPAAGQ